MLKKNIAESEKAPSSPVRPSLFGKCTGFTWTIRLLFWLLSQTRLENQTGGGLFGAQQLGHANKCFPGYPATLCFPPVWVTRGVPQLG